jgi:uncharacterized membrane protein (UPF0182 family)
MHSAITSLKLNDFAVLDPEFNLDVQYYTPFLNLFPILKFTYKLQVKYSRYLTYA